MDEMYAEFDRVAGAVRDRIRLRNLPERRDVERLTELAQHFCPTNPARRFPGAEYRNPDLKPLALHSAGLCRVVAETLASLSGAQSPEAEERQKSLVSIARDLDPPGN